MMKRSASCRCGQLSVVCTGTPVRVSACHCLECQKRTGSAFGLQARWPDDQVTLSGNYSEWKRDCDSGHVATYRFCPVCGSTLAFVIEGWPGVIAVPVGAFADPDFPSPRFSVYEHRKHDWVSIEGDKVEHSSDPSIAFTQGELRK
ncbi:GFA family protein [Roseibium sp. HPY-6]|uniref:GFA family protein n=1 Tax=Roseibium sp. HPY-6 TaxID=3229852 RepID=UPI0033902252